MAKTKDQIKRKILKIRKTLDETRDPKTKVESYKFGKMAGYLDALYWVKS